MSGNYVFTVLTISVVTTCPELVSAAVDPVSNWNMIAIQASFAAGQNGITQSRTLAIVQIAIHDALNTIQQRYRRYAFTGDAPAGTSVEAAIAAAARDGIVGAVAVGAVPFPGFGTPALQGTAVLQVDTAYQAAIASIPADAAKSNGIAVGQAGAQAILTRRNTDRATTPVVYNPGTQPGDWQPTPNPVPADPPAAADRLPALLPGWGQVTPFVLRRSTQFDPGDPPMLTGVQYARDYDEVKSIGEKNSDNPNG